MNIAEILFALCGAPGVSGAEAGAVDMAKKLLSPLGSCEITTLGSLICRMRLPLEDKPHILLTAHLDSIGLIVTLIDEHGFLRVAGCGGIDRATVLAARVVVHTQSGPLDGVICTVPPHLDPDDSKLPKIDELAIDVGLSSERARELVFPGDRVTFFQHPAELLNGTVCSGSLDDRAGCAAVIMAARALADAPLGCGLSVALTSQEETGGRGAATAAHLLRPTHALAVDVSFGHAPDSPKHKCGIMGKGVMLGIAPILDNTMFAGLKSVAEASAIPYQVEVMGGSTGTDADGIAASGAGVACAMLSIPQRSMHTPVETVRISDVEATAKLIAAYVTDRFGGNA